MLKMDRNKHVMKQKPMIVKNYLRIKFRQLKNSLHLKFVGHRGKDMSRAF